MLSVPKFLRASLLVAGALSTSAVTFAGEHHSKMAHDVEEARQQSGTVDVIIQYKHTPDDASDDQLSRMGGKVGAHLSGIKGTTAVVSGAALDQLERDSNVAHISLNHPLGARGEVSSISNSGEYTVEPINAPQVWAKGFDGTGIGVAVIDSGINPNEDFGSNGSKKLSRIVYSQSFVPGDPQTGDTFGHGTHVAGLIAGSGTNSTGKQYFRTFKGVAPNSN